MEYQILTAVYERLPNTYKASSCQEINLPLNEKGVPFALPYN
jgi:hypothetical protein